jgi:uncharacterized protein
VKKILIILCILLLIVPAAQGANLPLVVDGAKLLTEDAFADLTAEAGRISAEYGMDVVIVTTDGIGAKTARDYAADYYDGNGYGQGADKSGVMLLLSMEDRDWFILTTGAAIRTFTDYGIEKIGDDIVPSFSDGDYAEGFSRFLRDAEIFLRQDAAGEPYDVGNRVQLKTWSERALAVLPWMLGASVLIAAIGLFILGWGMNTARPERSANRYVREGSMAITRAGDYFLYHTQTRVKIPKNQSGGGSSTFKGSSGTSHGGGGGKF